MEFQGKVNFGLMMATYLTSGMSSFAVGFALAGYNGAGPVLEAEKPWDHIYTVLITAAGILGLMMGALLADYIIPFGRWRSALIANLIVIVSCAPMMMMAVWIQMIGRIMLGFGGGMFTVINSVWIAETMPAEKIGAIGTSINFGIVSCFLVAALIQGLTLPDVDAGEDVTPMSWRWGFMAPGVFAIASLLMWMLLIRSDSLFFLIE